MLQSLPAGGFERFCQRLLRESGFQEVAITGRSGDGWRCLFAEPSTTRESLLTGWRLEHRLGLRPAMRVVGGPFVVIGITR